MINTEFIRRKQYIHTSRIAYMAHTAHTGSWNAAGQRIKLILYSVLSGTVSSALSAAQKITGV